MLRPILMPFIEAWPGPSLGSFAHRQDKWRINKLLSAFLQLQNVTACSGQSRVGHASLGQANSWSCCPLAVDFLLALLLLLLLYVIVVVVVVVVVAVAVAGNASSAKLLKRQSIVQSCRSCLTCFKLTDEDEPNIHDLWPILKMAYPQTQFRPLFTWPISKKPAKNVRVSSQTQVATDNVQKKQSP